MILSINVIMLFLSSFLASSENLIITCPLEEGKLVPSISGFVRGEGGNRAMKITSNKNAEVYSVSNGVVEFIGNRTNIVRIVDGDMTYEYFGMIPELEEGQMVLVGSSIGQLEENFLVLSIKEKGKKVDPRKYINCIVND